MSIPTSSSKSSVFNKTMDNCDPVNVSGNTFFLVVYSLMSLVGLLLNGFSMKFYFCRAQHQSSSLMVYLKNLTAADFLLCLCLPLRIIKYTCSSTTIRLLYCSSGIPDFFLNMYASILFMGYIAANRYFKIIYPLGTHMLQTVQAAYIICTITWVCLMVPTIPFIILFLSVSKHPASAHKHCDLFFGTPVNLLDRIIFVSFTTVFLLVLIFLIFFYYSISCRVLLAQQKQLTSSRSDKLVKSRRKMLVLVSIFCLCFVPFHLVRLPYIFLWGSSSVNQVLYYLNELTIMMSVLNVCLDPFVYFFHCKSFRTQVKMRTGSMTARIPRSKKGEQEPQRTDETSSINNNQLTQSTQ